ncbi:MAG: phosphotransferase [Chloroflexi bacterium]|nr:phosphotransferase [Chloroflexota bacterium]
MIHTPSIPMSLGEVTAEWLTEALRSGGSPANTRVTSVDVQPFAVGRSRTGEIALLTPVYETGDAGLPNEIIAKIVSQSDANRQNAVEMSAFPREVQFYRSMASEVPFAIPRMIYGDFDPATRDGILLLNRVDGATRDELTPERQTEIEADVTELLTNLARMHARWWGGDSLPETGFMLNVRDEHFGHVLNGHEASLANLKPLLEKSFSVDVIRNLERLTGYREKFLPVARDMPRTFCHGDFHAQNILWNRESKSPRAWVLDWQMVTLGPGVLDLSTYLAIAIQKQRTSELLLPAIKSYHRELTANGVQGYGLTQLIEDYRHAALATLGVMVFALGSLEFIGPAFDAIVSEVIGNAVAGVEAVNGFALLS